MPRNIIISDDLEATIRRACQVHAGHITYAQPALDAVLDLIDSSHARQRARADQHAADNAALGALIDGSYVIADDHRAGTLRGPGPLAGDHGPRGL